ncbi:hypothetical protein DL669_23250, partial [Shigella flexneri]|nr:hypothetical protein [Shigella flexneri]
PVPFFRHKKTRIKRVLSSVHVCYSPRDTALRSLPELKQFMCKNARTFLKLHQPFHQFISANNKPTIGSRQFQP